MIYIKKRFSNPLNKKYLFQSILIFSLIIFPRFIQAQSPTYLLELRNDAQVSATEYEFDIYLLRTGTTTFEYASGQYGIVINPLIKNSGTVIASLVAGSLDPVLAASNQTPASVSFYDNLNVIRIAASIPPRPGNGAFISNIPPGTRICRVRLSNTVDFAQYQPNLAWTTTTIYPTQVYAYVEETNTAITNHSNHTLSNLGNPVLNVVTSSDNYLYDDNGLKVYPNPASERINIDYMLVQNSQVSLSVLDITGKQVEQLVNENQQAGNYSLTWIPESQPEGIYIVKLQTGMTQKISRVTLIR